MPLTERGERNARQLGERLRGLTFASDGQRQAVIEGNTVLAYSDDVATRFIGYGWNRHTGGDANDLEMLERGFQTFKNTTDRPTLIIVDSHIAYGAPHKQGTSVVPCTRCFLGRDTTQGCCRAV